MRRTKEETEQTRISIIENAVKLFLQKGFSNTKLEEIAAQANVTRGAIYWHFKDKLDIVNDLVETEHQNLTKLLKNLFEENISAIDKIDRIVTEIVKNFFENKAFRDFIELTWFKIEYTQFLKLFTTKSELNDYFIRILTSIVGEAKNQGNIKNEINELDVAITITNMINGMYRMYFILPDQINTKEEAMSTFNSYLKLIKT